MGRRSAPRQARNVATIFDRSGVSNAADLLFWREFLTNRFLSTRKWIDLPKPYTSAAVNAWMFLNGNVCMFRNENAPGKPIMLAPAELGPLNAWGEPTSVTVTLAGENKVTSIIVPYGMFVLWLSSPAMMTKDIAPQTPFLTMCYFSELATRCQRTVANLTRWRGFPRIYAVDQRTQREIDRILVDADNLETATYILKDSITPHPLPPPIDLAPNPLHDKACWDNLEKILMNYDRAIGAVPRDQSGGSARDRVTATEAAGAYIGAVEISRARDEMWADSNARAAELFGVTTKLTSTADILELMKDIASASNGSADENEETDIRDATGEGAEDDKRNK